VTGNPDNAQNPRCTHRGFSHAPLSAFLEYFEKNLYESRFPRYNYPVKNLCLSAKGEIHT